MPGIVEAGAVVGDGEFLDFFHGARVVNGDGRVVAEGMKEEHLLLSKTLHGAVNQLDHPQHTMLRLQGNADDGAGLPLGVFIHPLGKARIVVNIGNNQGFTVPGDPAGNALAHSHADGFKRLRRIANGDGKVQLVLLLIHHEQRPGVGTEELGHLLHDGLENGIEIERRGEGLGHIIEDGDFFQLPFSFRRCSLVH